MQFFCPVARGRQSLVAVVLLFSTGSLLAQLALIRQGPESRGVAEPGDWHGWAVALGDFNGDGYADLATGAPLEMGSSPVSTSGFVVVNPGSPHGLTWNGAYSLSVIDGSLDPNQNHQMGHALAVGDFNGDGYDDLAVGLPTSPVSGVTGFVSGGRVLVYYGGPGGLPGTASIIHSGMLGETPAGGDAFGAALGAGRLGDDAYDDLIIGAPGRNGARGMVFVIRGGSLGLNTSTVQVLTGADLGHANQTGDRFGSAIAAANIVGFPGGELIVGAPFATLTPGAPASGIVYIANTSDISVVTTNTQIITSLNFNDGLHSDGNFGAALCVGSFWGDDNTRDLAIGAPGNQVGGRVYVGRGTPLGIAWSVTLKQEGADQAGDRFGAALAAGDHNGNGYDDLAVGAPGEDFELAFFGDDTGNVSIFPGGPAGPVQDDVTTWWTIDLGDQVYQTAWLGHSLAAGRTSASARHSFVAGAPARDDARGQVFDIAPWRQVMRLLCRSAVAADCEDNVVYALRPFDRVKIASTTKIMTALLAAEATARPPGDPLRVLLGDEYTIEPWMYDAFPLTSACSIFGFTPLPEIISETLTLEDLLHACIMPSGNDACYAIADAMTGEIDVWSGQATSATDFVALMNARATQIGMTDTLFTNPAGVDSADPYSSAIDMWRLARAAMANPIVREVVNTTSYMVDKILMGGEAGIFNEATVNISYGWLTSMKNRDSRIIGMKPGGTPGAKSTGVVAARFDAAGNKVAYATGFGWDDNVYGRDKLAALVQLGLAFCNVDVGTPDGLSPAPAPTGSAPAGRVTFHYNHFNNAPLTAVQFGSFAQGEPSAVSLRGFTSAENDSPLPVVWNYRALWEMPPGSEAGVRIKPVVDGRVRLHLPYDRGTEPPPPASLLLSGTLHSGTVEPITLGDGVVDVSDFIVWHNPSAPAGQTEVIIIIGNNGDDTLLLSLDASFNLEMVFSENPAEPFHAELEPLKAPIRSGHVLHPGDYDGDEDASVEIIVENRKEGTAFVPPMRITRFDRQPATGRTEAISLEFQAQNWNWSLLPFIEEFIIESADAIHGSGWQPLVRIPAGSTPAYQWTDVLPTQSMRVLRLRTVAGLELGVTGAPTTD